MTYGNGSAATASTTSASERSSIETDRIAYSVILKCDGTSHPLALRATVFDELLASLEMRQLAYEPRTMAFHPHQVDARMLMQRLDRRHEDLQRRDVAVPGVLSAATRLRDMAEMSNKVEWSIAE